MRVVIGRQYLLNALRMGFVEIGIVDADRPLRCVRGQDKYVFLPLSKNTAITPGTNVIPIRPDVHEGPSKFDVPRRRGKMLTPAPVPSPPLRAVPTMTTVQKPSRGKLSSIVSGLMGCTRGLFGSFSLRRRKA